MDSFYYFVLIPMVYISFAMLVLGIVYKLIAAVLAGGIKAKTGTYPRELPRPLGVLKDSFLIPAAFRKDKIFWFFIMLFHACFLLLIIGHLELIREFEIIQIIPHKVFLGAGWVGILLVFSTLYFLFRRFRSPYRDFSVPEDYILLLLLFLTLIFGSHMNLAARYGIAGFDIPVDDYRKYLGSLLALEPAIPESISGSPHQILIVLHIFFANLFMMLFPFSKMIHSVFIFLTQNLRRK